MQLIEVSVTGVRSAVITLRRPETPMRFVLFPMLHLGAESFYQDVTERLRRCQIVVAEGIQGRSLITRALTLSYRLPGHRGRLGLVRQQIDYPNLGTQVITPDMTGRQLRASWRAVPALQSLAILCVVPLAAMCFWLLGTRRMLSRYARVEDLPGLAESRLRERYGTVTELLVDCRDDLLVTALAQIHQEHKDEPIDVAVVYGAGHMPAVARYLLAQHGYRPREAEWLTVFDL